MHQNAQERTTWSSKLHAALAEPRVLVRRGEDRTLSSRNVPAIMLNSAPGAATVTPDNALSIGDAYACVRALADAAASLPLHVYRRTADGRERMDGRTADLLRRPAPAVTQANLVGQLVAHLNLHGNAYLGKFKDAGGRVEQLALLAPDRVTPELRGGLPLYTVRDERGHQCQRSREFPRCDRQFSPPCEGWLRAARRVSRRARWLRMR